MKDSTRRKIYHGMSIAFIIAALCFSVFRFQSVFGRMIYAIKDVVLSIAFFLFGWIPGVKIPISVTEIPSNAVAIIPLTWEEFSAALKATWELMNDRKHFLRYLAKWLSTISSILSAIMPVIIVGILLIWIGYLIYVPKKKKGRKAKNGEKKQVIPKKGRRSETKQLKAFYKLEKKLHPIINFFRRYEKNFLRVFRWYRIALLLIWLYNLNVFTIVLEAVAYILYFSVTYDFSSLYSQFAKLAIDLYIPLEFLPWWAKLILGFKIFHAIRTWIGDKLLKKYMKKLMEWLEKIPGAIFFFGKQRCGKTTLATVMGLLESARFRIACWKALKSCRKEFPHFPWRNVERTIRESMQRHVIYNLPTALALIEELQRLYESEGGVWDENRCVKKIKRLKRKYPYYGSNLLFGYNYEKFPLTYNTALKIVNIFECLSDYARLYFIYRSPKPLIFSSYRVRTDEVQKCCGNLEKYDLNLTKRKSKDIKRISKNSHVLYWDSVRLGKLMDPRNEYKNAAEFGVFIATEYEKEVGNQNTTSGEKRDGSECNRKNDGHSDWIKTVTHMATIKGTTYLRWICDGHRTGGMAAEFNELCTNAHIKKKSESKIILPFFAFEEALWLLLGKLYDWLEDKFSYYRGDRTLAMYLIDKLYMPFEHYCDRIKNRYSCYTNVIDWTDGMNGESIKDNVRHVVPHCLAFNDRFATDTIGSFFYKKSSKSKTGVNDVPLFETDRMTFKEMTECGSHFYKRLGEQLLLEEFLQAKEERDKWLKEREKEKKAAATT